MTPILARRATKQNVMTSSKTANATAVIESGTEATTGIASVIQVVDIEIAAVTAIVGDALGQDQDLHVVRRQRLRAGHFGTVVMREAQGTQSQRQVVRKVLLIFFAYSMSQRKLTPAATLPFSAQDRLQPIPEITFRLPLKHNHGLRLALQHPW